MAAKIFQFQDALEQRRSAQGTNLMMNNYEIIETARRNKHRELPIAESIR